MLGSCKQCQRLVFAHGMGLKLSWLLVGHSLSLCSIFVPVLLVDKTKLGSKVLWMGWCLCPSTVGLDWLQKVTSSDSVQPLLEISAKITPIES